MRLSASKRNFSRFTSLVLLAFSVLVFNLNLQYRKEFCHVYFRVNDASIATYIATNIFTESTDVARMYPSFVSASVELLMVVGHYKYPNGVVKFWYTLSVSVWRSPKEGLAQYIPGDFNLGHDAHLRRREGIVIRQSCVRGRSKAGVIENRTQSAPRQKHR